MGVLRSIEHRIESIVEGVFGRAFRTHVQPVELARKLAKEMDDAKSVSVSRVYVPNEYTLYLCPGDREQFANYEDSLLTELSDYLSEHARREGYALLSTPVVLWRRTRTSASASSASPPMVQSERPQAPPRPMSCPRPCRARRGSTARRPRRPVSAGWPGSTSTRAGRRGRERYPPRARRRAVVVGRSSTCDIVVDDPNVSRRHAEIRREDGAYWIVDLGSTNGLP